MPAPTNVTNIFLTPATAGANTPVKKYFAVLERDFEYNDEYYSGGTGGRPKKLFVSKDKAQAHAAELTLIQFKKDMTERWSEFIPFAIGEDRDFVKYTPEVKKILDSIDIPEDKVFDYDFGSLFKSKHAVLVDDELRVILANLRHPLFEICEVEVGD